MAWAAPPERLRLGLDEVHLWRVRLDTRPGPLAAARAVLTPVEVSRAERLRFALQRDRAIAARGSLRRLLGAYLELDPRAVPLVTGRTGKPALEDGEIEFNLAHSADLALVAVTHGRHVGVDIERFRREIPAERIASRFFAPSETAALRRLPERVRPAAFFATWTRKEAYLKASESGLERGLAVALGGFSVSTTLRSPIVLEVPERPGESSRWSLHDVDPGAGYAAALAVEGSVRPRYFEWRG